MGAKLDFMLHGSKNPKILCPQCGERGHVRTQPTTVNTGVSGGKAAAAVFTGGLSLLAVGLARKQRMTEAWCENCKSTWHF